MPETCTKCSAALDADAIFCPSCATPVNPQCPNCGKPVIAEAKFCKYCAFDLTQKISPSNTQKLSAVSSEQSLNPKQRLSSTRSPSLPERYRALSDSELLEMLKGDLSGYTEPALSLALTELETRTNIDWLPRDLATKRIQEAIRTTRGRYSTGTSHYSASHDLNREKAKKLTNYGVITAGISGVLFLWGSSYTNDFSNSARAGLSELVGQADSTYRLAQLCKGFGAIGLIVGIVLVIVGLMRQSS